MATVLDHVLDTVQHLLKKKVALERAIDPDTPDIIADGSRIVQVCLHVRLSCGFLLVISEVPAALHECHWHLGRISVHAWKEYPKASMHVSSASVSQLRVLAGAQ